MTGRGDKALYAAIAALFAVSCAWSGWHLLRARRGDRLFLEIVSDRTVVRTVALPASDEEIRVARADAAGGGYNILAVGPDGAKIVSSDCRGGDCLRTPQIARAGGVIACVPHGLIVRIRGAGAAAGEKDAQGGQKGGAIDGLAY